MIIRVKRLKLPKSLIVGVFVVIVSFLLLLLLINQLRGVTAENRSLSQKLEKLNAPASSTEATNKYENLLYTPISGQLILSKAEVYFDSNNHGQLTLSSVSPIVYQTTKKEQYCGSSALGLNNYSGKFCLEFQGNNFDLGELSFSDGTPHDGQLRLYKLDTTSDRDFIAIFQYGSCNVDYLSLYGLGDNGQWRQYSFKYKNGVIRKTIPVERWGLPEIPQNKVLVTTWYDNTVENSGKKTVIWKFNIAANSFDEI